MSYRYKRQQPDILKGVVVSTIEAETLNGPIGSWASLHRWLMSRGGDRDIWERKALMLEVNTRKRPYVCGRLSTSILAREHQQRKMKTLMELAPFLD